MAKVLVVDDNAVNRDLVVTLLGYQGHHADARPRTACRRWPPHGPNTRTSSSPTC